MAPITCRRTQPAAQHAAPRSPPARLPQDAAGFPARPAANACCRPNNRSASSRRKPAICDRLQPGRHPVGPLDRRLDCGRQNGGQAKAQMHRRRQPRVQLAIARTDSGFHRADHVADHIFRRVVQQRRQPPSRRLTGVQSRKDLFHQQRMLGHRIGPVAPRLAVPARDEGQSVGDILDFDIHRRRVQQVEPPARQHPLPRAAVPWPFRSPILPAAQWRRPTQGSRHTAPARSGQRAAIRSTTRAFDIAARGGRCYVSRKTRNRSGARR